MKIIDADALKEVIKANHYLLSARNNSIDYGMFTTGIMQAIDHAPTVDIKDEIAGAYNEGYMCGNKEAEKARPQGKWYYSYLNGWHCSICNETVKDMPTVMGKAYFNFCPNCGADMRKGGAK